MEKKTKIVATISDFRCDVDYIRSLYEAGMNAVRINSAHAPIEGANQIVDNVRKVSDSIPIIIDTKGPEIRITEMAEEFKKGVVVAAGSLVNVKGTDKNLPSNDKVLYMSDPDLFAEVPVGARILVDDGEMEMEVVEKKDDTLICRMNNGGVIKPRKSVNIPGVATNLPSITAKDHEYILWAIEKGIDFIAHSFVRSKEDVREVQKILDAHNSEIKIISKIENSEGVDNIDEILQETYGVMVARGDLGVEIPAEKIPETQRRLVNKCIQSKTPVIIATQMLHSMINNPRPTRAEVSDIANAIYQKVDAIMLSGETANGDYPVEAVTTMAKVASQIEQDTAHRPVDTELCMMRIDNEITAQLARSAVRATENLPIKAIIIDSLSGRTGRYIAAFRSNVPVYAVCYRKSAMRQLGISYGVHGLYKENDDCYSNFILSTATYLEETQSLKKEDRVVVVGGSFGPSGGASFMEIGTLLDLEHKARNKGSNCNNA